MDFNVNYTIYLAFAAVVIYSIYCWFSSFSDYWELQGVPCFNPSKFVNLLMYMTKPLHKHEWDLYKKYGRVYGRYDGQISVLTVGDPEILKNILVKDFHVFPNRRDCKFGDPICDNNVSLLNGEDWKRVRNILTPTFTSGKLKLMRTKLDVCVDRFLVKLKTEVGSPIDLEKLFSSFSMDVIANCAFGTKINCLETTDNPFVVNAKSIFHSGIRSSLAVFFPFLMKIFHISMLNPKSMAFFRDFTMKIVEERSKIKEPGADFLQLLLDAEKNDENTSEDGGKSKFLTHDELTAQCVLFFMAGYDTTSSLLQVTLYNLAMNQKIQDRLYDEIMTSLSSKEKVENDDIVSLKYLDCVISEGLRFGSACIRMDRRAEEDYMIESKNILIKKGQLISLPMYCIHHDPEFYPEPEKFDPERFTAENKAARHPFTYMPFGIGPRSCVGNRFALMEVKLCLIRILQQYKILPCAETVYPLNFKDKQGQLIPEKIIVAVEPRY